ncbi:DUF2512 family protein [Oceanobacillus piezotolerans]|uniref:DUF2512 family protein n=1 Tax=Oceanobacillus piezotolerans TaxID=2448030 RepID=A0A498D9H7_9BACI|nr:DUF2512 family protein [Oceanobacillus piezotolerans]RLL43580.1 DUF2512 family protein [Oceanobacillus piezotolerans]
MKKHAKALAIKGVMTLIVLYLVLGLSYGMSFGNVLLVTLVLGLVSYGLGDLYILPKSSNVTATLADFGMVFLIIWLLGMAVTDLSLGTISQQALISALVMAAGEFIFHIYILKKGLGLKRRYRTIF